MTLPQTETVFKGLKRAVDRGDRGMNNDGCSVRFNNCIFYSSSACSVIVCTVICYVDVSALGQQQKVLGSGVI